MRLKIGLKLSNFTLYKVKVSFLANEENKKYIFHNNYFDKVEIKFLPKDCGVPNQKSVEVTKLKILHR